MCLSLSACSSCKEWEADRSLQGSFAVFTSWYLSEKDHTEEWRCIILEIFESLPVRSSSSRRSVRLLRLNRGNGSPKENLERKGRALELMWPTCKLQNLCSHALLWKKCGTLCVMSKAEVQRCEVRILRQEGPTPCWLHVSPVLKLPFEALTCKNLCEKCVFDVTKGSESYLSSPCFSKNETT